MGYEKRRVNITFVAPDCATITNIYYQKTFYLTKECIVDLFNLKKIEIENLSQLSQKANVDSPFFVCFSHDEEENCYVGMVILRPGKDKMEVLEKNLVSIKDNNKTYSASVWVND